MTIKVVSNSTPLIALAQIGRFNILKELFTEIIIPDAVYTEVVVASKGRAGGKELESAQWIKCYQVNNRDLITFLKISLDDGEAEAIALANEIDADLLLKDDGDGRSIAESVGNGFYRDCWNTTTLLSK